MSKEISKISAQNFSEAVNYAYLLNKKTTVKIRVRKVVLPLGSILFAFFALIILLGAFYSTLPEEEVVIFDSLSFIPDIWNKIIEFVRGITELWYLQLILIIALLYLVPFVVCSIVYLAIFLITKVPKPVIEGSTSERAKQLCLYSCNIPSSTDIIEDAHLLWRRISGIAFVVGIVAFLVYGVVVLVKNDNSPFSAFALDFIIEGIIGFLISMLVIYLIYTLFYRLFTLTVKCFYNGYDDWNSFAHKAREYWVSVDPVERKKIEDEERAEKLREEREARSSRTSYSYSGYTGTSSAHNMSYSEKQAYIDKNCHGMFSYGGIQTIENDSSLTDSQKEDLKMHLKIYGD